jgi:signal transduction histidine kinase
MHAELENIWTEWNREAPWPHIIAGVAFLESGDNGWRTRSLGDPGTFDVQSILQSGASAGSLPTTGRAGRLSQDLFLAGRPSLLRPLPALPESHGQPRMNWVLIRFNESYLAGTLFPLLVEKYTSPEDRMEFRIEIRTGAHPNSSTDIIVADLLHYRPDCLQVQPVIATVMSGVAQSVANAANGAVAQFSGFAPESAVGQRIRLASLFHAVGHCEMQLPASSFALMQIAVRRSQGTLSDIYAGFRRRNEFLSGLVLAVLLGALAVLVVSTDRTRRLARLETVVAASISHELRTPLASLRVAADDLKSGYVDSVEQARRYGEIIDVQSRRLGHVVDQALALTKLTEPNGAPCLGTVSIPEIFKAALSALASRLDDAKIEVTTRIASDLPRILGDRDLVLRCMTNLVENSIKYAGSGRCILLCARSVHYSGRALVEVTVEDRGPGIREDEADAVFEPFYRGESARQSRQSGSGLGLAIVKRAVEAHGGWIKLDRAVPQGCRVQLFFHPDNRDAACSSEYEEAR